MSDWTAELARRARQRFAKWDESMWRTVVEGPAKRLAEQLDASDRPADRTRPVLEAYLEFAAEAVGLGYIYPSEATGRENFFHLAWFDLLPEHLPQLAPERQVEILAACWNLGENFETRPGWIQQLFMQRADELEALENFEERVEGITNRLVGTPKGRLEPETEIVASARTRWIYLGDQHPRFLPGAVEFLAPGVACIHHRHTGIDGTPKTSVGLSLVEEPELLGTMRVDGPSGDIDSEEEPWWERLAATDERFTSRHATASNDCRAVCSMDTSQYVVAVLPGVGDAAQGDADEEEPVVLGFEE